MLFQLYPSQLSVTLLDRSVSTIQLTYGGSWTFGYYLVLSTTPLYKFSIIQGNIGISYTGDFQEEAREALGRDDLGVASLQAGRSDDQSLLWLTKLKSFNILTIFACSCSTAMDETMILWFFPCSDCIPYQSNWSCKYTPPHSLWCLHLLSIP